MSNSQNYYQNSLDMSQIQTASDNLRHFFSATRQLVDALNDIQTAGISNSVSSIRKTLNAAGLKLKIGPTCGEPSRACCDPDLGRISKTVRIGERVALNAKLNNSTDEKRTFILNPAHPFRNSRGESGEDPIIKNNTITLEPGETGQVCIWVDVTSKYSVGDNYCSRIVIKSKDCDPQYFYVDIDVESEDKAPTLRLCCDCSPPVNRLRYYHHFYCDENKKPVRIREA